MSELIVDLPLISAQVRKYKRVPAHLCLDGAAAWNGAKSAMQIFWGDKDEEAGCEFVQLAEGRILRPTK